MRAGARYALSFAAAAALGLVAFPWILRLSARLAAAWSDAAQALLHALFPH